VGVHSIRELTAADAKAVARLGRKLYPRGFREGWQSIRDDLAEADAGECNLSVGVFHERRLVGYIVAYLLETSALKHLPDVATIAEPEVIYVNDLVVRPHYRRHVRELLRRFAQACRLHFPEHAVVAHGLQKRMRRWIMRHKQVLERMAGYRLVCLKGIHESDTERALYLAQWRPIAEAEWHALAAGARGKSRLRRYEIAGRVYTLELIQDIAQWRTLEQEWDRLLEQTPEHTVFQTFTYLYVWWRHFGLSRTLYILVIRRDSEIIGVAPLQISPVSMLHRYYRELGFIGSRWEVDRPVLLFPTSPQACCEAMLRFLLEQRNDWDLCDLYEQARDSALINQLQSSLRARGYLLGMTADSLCPYLRLDGTWQRFLATKSQKFRKNLKAARKRLERAGKLAYINHRAGDMTCQLERYAALENKSWKAKRKVGCNRSNQYFSFYRDLASALGRSDKFQVRFLALADEPIAGTFGLLHNQHYYSLQIVHNPDYSNCSPGTLLEALEIEECFASGYREYDFLGGFLSNKVRWTDQGRRTVQLYAFRRTPRLWLFHFTYFVAKPWVKRRLHRWGIIPRLLRLQTWLRSRLRYSLPSKLWKDIRRRGLHGY
jgi:CelD/BcsL family acetyltransferase involved in cellulose biosynthesis